MSDRDELAEAFKGHAYDYPDSFCECTAWIGGDERTWRQHQADVLLASDWFASVRADALHQAAKGSEDCAPDCVTRTACAVIGTLGHFQCGLCPEHEQPRHHCGCLVLSEPAPATPQASG